MIRAVGEPRMPVPTEITQTVVFITKGKLNPDHELVKDLIGTGFVVEVPAEDDPSLPMFYVVTAGHVVRGIQDTMIRIPLRDSPLDQPDDRPVERWIFHREADVAVTPILPDEPRRWRPIKLTIPKPPRLLEYGNRVYFVGMLGVTQAMKDRVVPIVRSGTLAYLNLEGIKVKDVENLVRGHLIDSRSLGGFSGSPCWVQQEDLARDEEGRIGVKRDSMLLGMILGHLPAEQVAVVTPLEDIIETIMEDKELKTNRQQRVKAVHAAREHLVVEPDSVEEFSKDDFQAALRRVSRRIEPSEPESSESGT